MRRKYSTYLDVLLISTFAVVPLLWFREGYTALAGFDFAVYLDPVGAFEKSLYLWSDLMAGGYDTSHEVSSIPYYMLFSVPMMLGSTLYGAERFVFTTLFVAQGLAAYYMMRVLFAQCRPVRAMALSGAVLYAFSYPVMAHFGRGNMMALLTYAVMPVLIGLIHRGLADRTRPWRYVMLIALLSFPMAATKGHPADFVVMIAVAAAFTLFRLLGTDGAGLRHGILFTARALVALALVNAWWVVPNAVYLTDFGLTGTELVEEGFYNLSTLGYYSSGTSILNIFRNDRLDLWFDIPADALYNPGLYATPLFVLIGVSLPVAAYAAPLLAGRDRNVAFFSMLGVAAVFMYKGSHAPLGGVFEWLYLNVPGVFFFRAPYRVFSSLLTFALAPLIAYAVGSVAGGIAGRFGGAGPESSDADGARGWPDVMRIPARAVGAAVAWVVVLPLLSASTLYAWPLFTGTHLREFGTEREPGVFHRIPSYYDEADRWLSARLGAGEGKLYYPYEVYDANTTWGYNGPDPSFELLGVPKVVSRPGGTVYVRYQKPIERLNGVVRGWRYGDLSRVLALYNAGYVLVHGDFNPWVMPEFNYNDYLASLLATNGMGVENESGPLRFYGNPERLGPVYGAGRAYVLAGDERAWPALSLTPYLDRPFMVMTKDIPPGELARVLERSDGIIYYNSNKADAAGEMLAGTYGGVTSAGTLRFTAGRPGEYLVLVKGERSGEVHTFVDGVLVAREDDDKEGAGDGFDWTAAGTVYLAPGEHVLDRIGLWSRSGDLAVTETVVVVPYGAWLEVLAALEGKMAGAGSETVYLLDTGTMKGERARVIDLPKGYTVSAMAPSVVERRVVDAMEGRVVEWTFDDMGEGGIDYESRGGSVILKSNPGPAPAVVKARTALEGVEAGSFTDLEFTVRNMGPGRPAGASLALTATVRTDGEKSAAVELWRGGPGDGMVRVDLSGRVKKALAYSGTHEITALEWEAVLEKGDAPGGIEISRPLITGRFGVEEGGCGGKTGMGALLIDGKAAAIGPGECGRWVEAGGGRGSKARVVPSRRGEGSGRLVLIESGMTASGVGRGPEVEARKVNPARWEGRTDGAGLVVFTDSYDKDWELDLGSGGVRPVKVNGFANGYFLDEGDGGGFTLEYIPQRYYRLSALVSAASLAGVLLMGTGLAEGRKRGGEKR